MVKKYAFLFPGQGAQTQGMIRDVAENFKESMECLDKISSVLNEDIKALLWDTPSKIMSRSDKSQIAITAASLAIMEALKVQGITPSAAMGFSLGEFPALYAAGVLDFERVLSVVKERGKIMQKTCDKIAQASAGSPPGMTAIVGLAPDVVVSSIKDIKDVYAANMNSIKQTVISGTNEGLKEAEAVLKDKGARRAVRLSVAGPFHSPLMIEAANEFGNFLKDIPFNEPKITLFSNVTGQKVASGSEAKESSVKHLVNPVLWTSEEAKLASLINEDKEKNNNDWALLEVGPGKVLSGLWRDFPENAGLVSIPISTFDAFGEIKA